MNKELEFMIKQKVNIEDSHKSMVKEKSNLQKEIRNREQTIKQLQEQIMTLEGKLIRAEAKLGVKFSNTPDPLTEINEKLTQINKKISEIEEKKRAALERAEKFEALIQEQNTINNQMPERSSGSESENSDGGDDVIDFNIPTQSSQTNSPGINPFLMGVDIGSVNSQENQGNNMNSIFDIRFDVNENNN